MFFVPADTNLFASPEILKPSTSQAHTHKAIPRRASGEASGSSGGSPEFRPLFHPPENRPRSLSLSLGGTVFS